MKKNIGRYDKIFRIALAASLVVLYLTDLISGTWAVALGSLALVLVITSFVGFCPLYLPFGISTAKRKKA